VSSILVICTGNAARSVMVGAIVNDRRPDLNVVTAGTLTMDGQPISWRTREALRRIELEAPHHRSKQMQTHHGDEAQLIIALAPEHVEWVRRNLPHVAHKTVTLKRLVTHLSPDRAVSLDERVAALRAHEVNLEPWEEVVDPGGGEVEDFINCAIEVVALCDELCPRL
jgi:protein-tyrosine-phosphatase